MMVTYLRAFLLLLLVGFIAVSGFQVEAWGNLSISTSKMSNEAIYWFDWSDDGTKVAVATANEISVYDSSFHLLVSRPQPDPTERRSFGSLSPDGSKLTALREIWDIQTLQQLLQFDSIYSLGDWSHDGKLISTVGNDMKSILLYDTTTGELVKTISTGDLLLTFNPIWSPDNTRFAITENNYTLAIIDASTGQIIAHYPHEELIETAITWSHDGKQIAYTGFPEPKPGTSGAAIKHSVFITNLMSGQTLRLASDLHSIFEFDWSRDDTQLLATGVNEVYIWDVKRGELVERYNVLTWPFHAEYSAFSGQIMMGFNLYWYKSSAEFTVQAATQHFLNGAIQIIVPTPSLDKLKSITQACGLQANVQEMLISQLKANDLNTFKSHVAKLKSTDIPEGCQADLLVVADVLMAK